MNNTPEEQPPGAPQGTPSDTSAERAATPEPATAPPSEPPQSGPPQSGTPRWRRWLVDLALVLLVFVGISAYQARNLLPSNAPAPPFALAALQGPAVALTDLSGKPALLYIWAPWCGVCTAQAGAVDDLFADQGEDFRVVSVVQDFGSLAEVRQSIQDSGVRYPVLLADRAFAQSYQVRSYPTVYILDPQGHIRQRVVGYTPGPSLRLRLWLSRYF